MYIHRQTLVLGGIAQTMTRRPEVSDPSCSLSFSLTFSVSGKANPQFNPHNPTDFVCTYRLCSVLRTLYLLDCSVSSSRSALVHVRWLVFPQEDHPRLS